MTEKTALINPAERVATKISALATALVVRDDGDYELAGTFLLKCKTAEASVRESFDEPIKQAHKTHQTMIASRRRHLKPIHDALALVKSKMATFAKAREDENRRRAEAQRVAQEKALEDERRLQSEARRMADEIFDGANEPPPVAQPAPVVQPEPSPLLAPPPKVKGVSVRKRWTFEIVGELPREYMVPDLKAIRQAVQENGLATRIEGVRVFQETGVAC